MPRREFVHATGEPLNLRLTWWLMTRENTLAELPYITTIFLYSHCCKKPFLCINQEHTITVKDYSIPKNKQSKNRRKRLEVGTNQNPMCMNEFVLRNRDLLWKRHRRIRSNYLIHVISLSQLFQKTIFSPVVIMTHYVIREGSESSWQTDKQIWDLLP